MAFLTALKLVFAPTHVVREVSEEPEVSDRVLAAERRFREVKSSFYETLAGVVEENQRLRKEASARKTT